MSGLVTGETSSNVQEFSGRWIVQPDPSVRNGLATSLRYEVSIVPKWSLPSTVITTVVRCGLPSNVRAIAEQAEKVGPAMCDPYSMTRPSNSFR